MKTRQKQFPDNTRVVYTNGTGSALASGAVVRFGTEFGILTGDCADGASVVAETRGQFRMAKATGASSGWSKGDALGWDATNKVVKKIGATATFPYIGTAAADAADAATMAEVNLNANGGLVALAYTCSAGDDSANQADVPHNLGKAPTQIVSVQIQSTGNVRRLPGGAVTAQSTTAVRVVDASLAVNEVIHVLLMV